MSKGEETRERVLRQVAVLLNRQGFAGSSFTHIMRETGLQKGGIYNHFASKEELALEAFDYAVGLVRSRYREAIAAKANAADKLLAVASVFHGYTKEEPLPGGCPVMNTAIEADDSHPALRERARQAMNRLHGMVRRIVTEGIERREVHPTVDPDETATLLIATLEGALMMSRLYGNDKHMRRAINHLTEHIENHVRA